MLTDTSTSPVAVRVAPPAARPPQRRVHHGYAGPLTPSEPVRSEAGIPIPPYVGCRRAYTGAAWQGVLAGFGATGDVVTATWSDMRAVLSDARGDVSHLLRTEDMTVSALLWHVQALGRTMQRRLQIDGVRHGQTQDSVRVAIQDTWLPGVTTLRRVVHAIAAQPRVDLHDLWGQVADVPAGRALVAGLAHHGQWLPVGSDEVRRSLAILNHREVLWSVAAASAEGRDLWSDRSLFHTIQESMARGGGAIYRSRRGFIIGGMPGADHYVENEPSHVLYRAADACWAQALGLPAESYRRDVLPPDLATATQLALGAVCPALATPAPLAPDLAAERQAWTSILQPFARASAVDPAILAWWCARGQVERRGEWVVTTHQGRERWLAIRSGS